TRLVESPAPLPAIGRARDIDHSQTMIFGCAPRVAHDDHVLADFDRIARDALPAKLSAAAPLYAPAKHLTGLRILGFQGDEGMRIPEQELRHVSLEGHRLIFEIGRGEGMVRIRGTRR